MVSTYEFKNLERELSSIEKDFNQFENSFDNALKPILSASFNKNQYGSRAIEDKLNKFVDNAKKDVNRLYNEFVNDVRRETHSSLQKIKSKAKETYDYIDELNRKLDKLNDLNRCFAEKQFVSAISIADEISSYNSEKDLCKYALLVQLESYEALCSNKLKNISPDDYSYFKKYYDLCIRNNAEKHIISSKIKLFKCVCLLIEKYSDVYDISQLYDMTSNALQCYSELSNDDKNRNAIDYGKLYDKAVIYYNDYSDKSYRAFEYVQVKNLLSKSRYYKTSDIRIDFFKDSALTPTRVFAYIKEFGENGSLDNIKAAFDDSRSLDTSDKKELFIDYWCSTFDKNGWYFCESIVSDQPNKYQGYELIANSLKYNYSHIRNSESLASCFYESYIQFLKEQSDILFDDFINTTIAINDLVECFRKSCKSEDKNNPFVIAIKGFDGTAYGMLTKYYKLCCTYSERKIVVLNKVLDDASKNLYGKKYRKNLRRDETKPAVELTGAKVKLVTVESKSKKIKTVIIVGAIAIAVLIILLVAIFGL